MAQPSRSSALELARKGSVAGARKSGSKALPPASPSSLASAVSAESSGDKGEAFDPLSVLYGRRLWFENSEPLVTVRVLEGERSFRFTPLDSFSVQSRGKHATRLQFPAGGRWTVRLRNGLPGTSVDRVLVGEHLFANSEAASADAELFRQHGWQAELVHVGGIFGISGQVIDTRRILVLLPLHGGKEEFRRLGDEIEERFGQRPNLHKEALRRASGQVELLSPTGEVVLSSPDALTFEHEGERGFELEDVEYGMGYAHHGRERRRYRGRLFGVVDSGGKLAAVNQLSLEALTRGIVPSEIFASAHPEALKAQALTARGEILAKVGTRHLADPYLLCAEQDCQVFRGVQGEDPRTNQAVEATVGEALFKNGALVPSYYSAVCGGHTENNDAVWGGPANEAIRGRPDFEIGPETAHFSEGIGEALLRKWLASDLPAFCRSSSFARADRFRWERSFSQKEVDAIASPYAVGRVRELVVKGRGVSGRAKALLIKGDSGEATISSELSIRRLFRMLNSGMFVVDSEGQGASRRWIFRGGGWGHGAGMCQIGAIGRAEAGASYREILAHYYSDAEVRRLYG